MAGRWADPVLMAKRSEQRISDAALQGSTSIQVDRLESMPLFLVGAERSGTTLLRLLLNQHPLLAWLGEFEFAVDHLSESGAWPPREEYVARLRQDRVFNHWGFAVSGAAEPPDIAHACLLQWHRRHGGSMVGATIHRHLHRIPLVWPKARYIHIVRDPRDVASSMVAMGWDGNVFTAIDRWIEVEESWARLRDRISPDDWIETRFEALIRSPSLEIAKLCRFMGIPFDAAMTAPCEGSTYSAPDASLTNQWRQRLSQSQLRWIESKAAEMMVDRGYEPSNGHWKPLGPIESRLLRIASRVGKTSAARRTLGTRLWLAAVVSKRTSLEGWSNSVRRRIHEITEQNLR